MIQGNNPNHVDDERKAFVDIFRRGTWNPQVRSGHGARISETHHVRQIIPQVIQTYNIRSFLDIPCGDCTFMSLLFDRIPGYVGADVVPDIIQQNRRKFPHIPFQVMSAMTDRLPAVDLIFCRDLLVHFNTRQILAILVNFKQSRSRYLLTTTFRQPHTELDIRAAGPRRWHPINLEELLKSSPPPIQMFSEHHRDYPKYLGLWDLSNMVVPLPSHLPPFPVFKRAKKKKPPHSTRKQPTPRTTQQAPSRTKPSSSRRRRYRKMLLGRK